MYVRTEPVHTYIAKAPKRSIYAILYDDKVVPVNLTSTTQVHPSCHGDISILMALDKMELLTNSGIVQINLFQICCLLKNGKKKDAWRRHPIYFIIRFKLIAVAERRQ